jgi:hypothetical protein
MINSRLSTRTGQLLAWLLVLLPMAAFAVFILEFSVNSPFWDDYDTVLGTVVSLQEAPNFRAFLDVLVGQHNEHRIFFVKLLPYLYAKAFGSIDFKVIIELASLQLVVLFLLLAKTQQRPFDAHTLWPVSVLLFQPSYYEAVLWVTASLSNISVVLLAFAALYLLLGKWQSFVGAVVLAVFATYSQANGLFAFIAGAAGLLAQRRFRAFGLWLVVATVVGLMFFHDYTRPPIHPAVDLSTSGIWRSTLYFIAFVGNIGKSQGAAFVFGTGIIAAVAILGKHLWQQKPLLGSFILFLILTSASAAMARAPFGVGAALGSRYTFVSTMLLVLVYLAFLSRWPGRRTVFAFGALAIVLAGVHWNANGNQASQAQKLAAQGRLGELCYQNLAYPRAIQATRRIERAEAYHFFTLPVLEKQDENTTIFCHEHVRLAVHKISPTKRANFAEVVGGGVDSVICDGEKVRISGWAPVRFKDSVTLHVAVPNTPITSEIISLPRSDIVEKLGDRQFLNSGFRIDLVFETPEQACNTVRQICVGLTSEHAAPMLIDSPDTSCRRFLKGE